MTTRLGRTVLFGTTLAFALTLVVAPSLSETEFAPARPAMVHTYTKIADTHADVCLANEQQCLQACGGATSCSNQCEANYQGCMSQGQ